MPPNGSINSRDSQLVQIVDAAFADSARRSGKWLACRPGCTQCCMGVFSISQLDALRLQGGMAELESRDPERAARVRERARAAMERLRPEFPGNAELGTVDENAPEFDDFANDEPCPALDPQTSLCDLYASRPMTCRVFGVPLRTEDGVGVCELCFHGARNEEIAACELRADTAETENELIAQAEADNGKSGSTVVAFALVGQPSAGR